MRVHRLEWRAVGGAEKASSRLSEAKAGISLDARRAKGPFLVLVKSALDSLW